MTEIDGNIPSIGHDVGLTPPEGISGGNEAAALSATFSDLGLDGLNVSIQDGKVSVGGEIPLESYDAVAAAVNDFAVTNNMSYDITNISTNDQAAPPSLKRALEEAGLPPAAIAEVAKLMDPGDMDSPIKFGNPWLKPSGLVALQTALMDLAKVQSQIKLDSSNFFKENLAAIVGLAMDIAEMIVSQSKLEAASHRTEAAAKRKEAVAHMVSAIVQAITLTLTVATSIHANRSAGKEMRGLRDVNQTRMAAKQQSNMARQDHNRLTAENSRAGVQTNPLPAGTKPNPAAAKQDILRARNPAERQAAQQKYHDHESAASKARMDNSQMKFQQLNKEYQGSKSGILAEKSARIQHSTGVSTQINGITNSIVSSYVSTVQAEKEGTLAEIATEKGVINATIETLRANKQIAEEAMKQAEKDSRAAAETFSSVYATIKDMIKGYYQFNINTRS